MRTGLIFVMLASTGGCGRGAASQETTVARDPVPDEPFVAPPTPEQSAQTQIAQEQAARPAPTPCEAACTTLGTCQEGGFADRTACAAACEPAVTEAPWACRTHASTCGDARLCVAPTKVRGRHNARSLSGPLAVALEYRRKSSDETGAFYTLVARITDATRASRDLAVAEVFMDDAGAVMSVEPAQEAGGPLFTDQRFYAGAWDNFRVTRTGDNLVIEHQHNVEGPGPVRPFRPAVRIELPRGAELTAATLPL